MTPFLPYRGGAAVLPRRWMLAHLVPLVERWLVLSVATQPHLLDAVGQVGVLLLVGLAGMQLEAGQIRHNAGKLAKVGLGGMLIPLAPGLTAGLDDRASGEAG